MRVAEQTVLQTHTLELIGSASRHVAAISASPLTKEMLDEMKENLIDLLPEGYSVRIKEWDE